MSNISKNKIIWTNGCFDILHTGHIELLKFAKSKGDFLFVGIDSDKRVKNLKGEKRPINSQWDRKKMLESIKYVDKVFIFDDEHSMEEILIDNKIDLIVIGDEYTDKKVTGSRFCEISFFKKIPGKSTSNLINKILDI
jgi:rfaE bifunctional protein nucleotidyltransferase chain/domain